MVEVIIKRKIIKKKKPKKPKKKKPTQEQKQTQKQIINIYNSGALRNPLGIKRQKQKDKISPLNVPRVYRPISITPHVNSFEVEQRLYKKLADENRMSQLSQQRERETLLREAREREAEMKKQNEKYQQDVFEYIKAKEKKYDEIQKRQLEEPQLTSFEDIPSKGYGDNPLDPRRAEEPEEPEEKDDDEPSVSTPSITVAEPIPDVISTPPAGVEQTRPPTPPQEEEEAEIQQAQTAPLTITEKYNSLTDKQKEIIREEILKKYPDTKIFKGKEKNKLAKESTIKSMMTLDERNSFNNIYEQLTTGTKKKKGRPKKEQVV